MKRSSRVLAALFVVLAAGATPALAKKESLPPQPPPVKLDQILAHPNVTKPIQGYSLTIQQVVFPNVEVSRSCRIHIQAHNNTDHDVGLSTLLHTFGKDDKTGVNSWTVPIGNLAPGKSIERTYTCQYAAAFELSLESEKLWPERCEVGGVQRIPCPISVELTSNLVLAHQP